MNFSRSLKSLNNIKIYEKKKFQCTHRSFTIRDNTWKTTHKNKQFVDIEHLSILINVTNIYLSYDTSSRMMNYTEALSMGNTERFKWIKWDEIKKKREKKCSCIRFFLSIKRYVLQCFFIPIKICPKVEFFLNLVRSFDYLSINIILQTTIFIQEQEKQRQSYLYVVFMIFFT